MVGWSFLLDWDFVEEFFNIRFKTGNYVNNKCYFYNKAVDIVLQEMGERVACSWGESGVSAYPLSPHFGHSIMMMAMLPALMLLH